MEVRGGLGMEEQGLFNGLAMLPWDGGNYIQMPFEDCTKYMYDKLSKGLVDINLAHVKEDQDETDLQGEIACSSGQCDVVF